MVALRELYAVEPKWESANALGWALLQEGQLDEALEVSQAAVKAAPDALRHYALDTRAEVLWSLGRKDEAIEIWRPLLRDHPEDYADKAERLLQN